jgi:hypothetical protein
MPAKPAQEPEPEHAPAPARTEAASTVVAKPTAAKATPDDVPAGRLPAGVYEFTGPLPTQYLEVPLTAHPATADREATVFAWPVSAPDDGRWQPTKKKPNSLPDNAPALSEGE